MHLTAEVSTPIEVPKEQTQGFSALLLGDSGCGKTDSIATLAECGLEVFTIFTEPGAWGVLKDSIRRRNLDINKFHYNYVSPAAPEWKALITVAKNVNQLEQSQQQKLSGDRHQYTQWVEFLQTFQNFFDERTKQAFGDVTDWGDDRVLVWDSLSGSNIMAMDLVVGSKPILQPADWQTTQKMISGLLNKLLSDRFCHLVVTGHVIRDKNEENGRIEKLVSAPGKALTPTIPRFFDNVILASQTNAKFKWSTSEVDIQLKGRHAGISNNLPASFVPLYNKWKEIKAL